MLALPGTIGSSSASAVLLELVHAGKAPAAILMTEPDAILLLGLRGGAGDGLGHARPRCACRWSGSGRWRGRVRVVGTGAMRRA